MQNFLNKITQNLLLIKQLSMEIDSWEIKKYLKTFAT